MLNTLLEQMLAEFTGKEIVPNTFYELTNGTYIFVTRDSAGIVNNMHFGKVPEASTGINADECINNDKIWRGFEFLSRTDTKCLAIEEVIESLNAIGLTIYQSRLLYDMFQSDMSFCEIQEHLTKHK